MSTGHVGAEALFPSARPLFEEPAEQTNREGPALRWLALLAVAGTVFMVGRWLLDWVDHNL